MREEHPQPQWCRDSWLSLNGEWEFDIDNACSRADRGMNNPYPLKINVPFCPESMLSGVENRDFMRSVWYRRTFETAEHETILLHFGACDYMARVYINGVEAGSHEGGYTPFCFDITDLCVNGMNTIIVWALDDVRNTLQPSGKQSMAYNSEGCFYTRTTGIWQSVWLEYVPAEYIDSAVIHADIAGFADIDVCIHGGGEVKAEVFYNGEPVGTGTRSGSGRLHIKLSRTELWEPGNGRLYDVRLAFGRDEVRTYFGLRSVKLNGGTMEINGKPVFLRMVLDQGFYPDGIYTAPDDDAFKRDIEISMAMGFNGARLHQKVFEPRFLYYCDLMGYMVFGEYASWGLDVSDPMGLYSFLPQWCEAVRRDINHPCIIGWIPFNETGDNADGRRQYNKMIEMAYDTTKLIDPYRPCIDASGWYHVKTDIFDVHDYEQDADVLKKKFENIPEGKLVITDFVDFRRMKYNGEPVFVSEYGGAGFSGGNAWSYGGVQSGEELEQRYAALTGMLLESTGIMGCCYTQLYDVEQECNGLYTFDRKQKVNPEEIRKVNMRRAACEK